MKRWWWSLKMQGCGGYSIVVELVLEWRDDWRKRCCNSRGNGGGRDSDCNDDVGRGSKRFRKWVKSCKFYLDSD